MASCRSRGTGLPSGARSRGPGKERRPGPRSGAGWPRDRRCGQVRAPPPAPRRPCPGAAAPRPGRPRQCRRSRPRMPRSTARARRRPARRATRGGRCLLGAPWCRSIWLAPAHRPARPIACRKTAGPCRAVTRPAIPGQAGFEHGRRAGGPAGIRRPRRVLQLRRDDESRSRSDPSAMPVPRRRGRKRRVSPHPDTRDAACPTAPRAWDARRRHRTRCRDTGDPGSGLAPPCTMRRCRVAGPAGRPRRRRPTGSRAPFRAARGRRGSRGLAASRPRAAHRRVP